MEFPDDGHTSLQLRSEGIIGTLPQSQQPNKNICRENILTSFITEVYEDVAIATHLKQQKKLHGHPIITMS